MSLYQQGVAARAARQSGSSHARSGESENGWLNTPSARRARIDEVDNRIMQFSRDLALADARSRAPGLLTQFNEFQRAWENWLSTLSFASLLLPSTEDWANRQDLQLEEFRKSFGAENINIALEVGKPPPTTPKPESNGWKTTALVLLAGVAFAGAALLVSGTKVINVKVPGEPA